MQPSDAARRLVGELSEILRPLGFKARARVFNRSVANVVHLVEVKASRGHSQAASSFTVNVGVCVPRLDPEHSASVAGAHWRERLGFLPPRPPTSGGALPISKRLGSSAKTLRIASSVTDCRHYPSSQAPVRWQRSGSPVNRRASQMFRHSATSPYLAPRWREL